MFGIIYIVLSLLAGKELDHVPEHNQPYKSDYPVPEF